MPLTDDIQKAIGVYRGELERLGPDGRRDFVDIARRIEEWPGEGFVASHARKWGVGRRPAEYLQWAFDIKNGAGVHVYAYIHPVHGNRGLAFVDLHWDAIVQVDYDSQLNMDCLTPPNGAQRWLTDKVALGTHWRLQDTER